jgi:hypothetical protein
MNTEQPADESSCDLDHWLSSALVDRVYLPQEGQSVTCAELPGPGHERPDVLGQAAAPETKARVEEPPPDSRVMTDRVGQQCDVGSVGGTSSHSRGRADNCTLAARVQR